MKKKYLLAQLQMLQSIYNFAFGVAQIGITNSVANLLSAFNLLQTKMTNVTRLFLQYDGIITGYAADKKAARLDLAQKSYVVMKAAYAYAVSIGNNVLRDSMKTSLSALKYMGYQKLAIKIGGVVNDVQPIMNMLQPFDPTINGDFNAMQTSLNNLNTLLLMPKEAIQARTVIGQNITADMKDAMQLTTQTIDPIVGSMLLTHPDYHSGYVKRREIYTPATRHTTLQATIVDELGQHFGPNIKVTVDAFTKTVIDHVTQQETTHQYKAKSAITDINGQVTIEAFEPGNRTVTVNGKGVVNKTFPVTHFYEKKTHTMILTCQPSFNPPPPPSTIKADKVKANK